MNDLLMITKFITHAGSVCMLYMVSHLPSIYPSHVSIYMPYIAIRLDPMASLQSNVSPWKIHLLWLVLTVKKPAFFGDGSPDKIVVQKVGHRRTMRKIHGTLSMHVMGFLYEHADRAGCVCSGHGDFWHGQMIQIDWSKGKS